MGGTSTDGRFIVWSCVSTAPCGASGKCVAGWFEVERRYWVVRLHAAPRSPGFLVRRGGGGGGGVCGWSSPVLLLCWQGGAGVGRSEARRVGRRAKAWSDAATSVEG